MRAGLVTIATVSALLVAAACSAPYTDGGRVSELAATEQPGGADPAPPDASTPPLLPRPTPGNPTSDAGPTGAPDSGGADASAINPARCPSKTVPALNAWKAPPALSGACTGADITYFAGVAAGQTWLGIQSLMTTRNASCSKCIFSKETDALWRPVVFIGAAGDAVVNYSSCFARAPGGSDACGKAFYQWSDCYAKVCDADSCGPQAVLDACYARQDVSDACAQYQPMTPCGGANAYAALDNICLSYVDVTRVMCSPGN